MRRGWVLNFDAEDELERGPRHTPGRTMQARLIELARQVAPTLGPGARVLEPALHEAGDGIERTHAWCPTPRALAALRRAGLTPPAAPSFDILRRVNERGFAFTLAGDELPDVRRATRLEEVEALVGQRGPTGRWRLKRGFGVAGRGQRPVEAATLGAPDRAWVEASLRRGALYVEPEVEIEREFSVHGWVGRGVSLRSIRAAKVVDRAWVSSTLAVDLDPRTEHALTDTALRVGRALEDAGYHGPFGVDAYAWSGGLRTLSEINARYCMGWDARDGWDPP